MAEDYVKPLRTMRQIMNRGGAHNGAGAIPHRVRMAAYQYAKALIETGCTPLDTMREGEFWFLEEARRWKQEYEKLSDEEKKSPRGKEIYWLTKGNYLLAVDCASKYANYLHPKLSAMAVKSDEKKTLIVRFEPGDELI